VVSGGDMRRCALLTVVCLLAAAGIGEAPAARGQGTVNREYQLKAVFIYKAATYIRWPEGAFADAKSPLVIGILGPDPVGADLRRIAKVKKIDGRRIEIRNSARVEEIRVCHILFMSRAVDGKTQETAIKRLSGRGILFIGETPEFLKQGGVLDFAIQKNNIVLFISPAAYKRERLVVSSQFLRTCTIWPRVQ